MKEPSTLLFGALVLTFTASTASAQMSQGVAPLLEQPSDAPWTVCFDANARYTPEIVEYWQNEVFAATLDFRDRLEAGEVGTSQDDYFTAGSWSGTGSPVNLTWSMVPDGVFISGTFSPGPSGNSELFSTMDAKFGGNRALWTSRIEDAFERWDEISGITFSRITVGGNDWDDGASWGASGNANRGDIRIGMREIDGGSFVLGFANFPTSGDMVLDRAESWQSGANSHRFLRNVVMHETGHALGLLHVCPINFSKLMEPTLALSFDGPRHDDLRAIHRQHGDVYEPDNASVNATDLGLLAPSVTTNPSTMSAPVIPNGRLTSIDANGETDWFRFTVAGPSLLDVSLIPVGFTYSNNQEQGQSCPNTNSIDSKSTFDLRVQVRDTNATTILADGNATGAGSNEVVTDVLLPGGGTYYVRITEQSSGSQTQLYSLNITANNTVVCTSNPDCDDNLFCNGVETCDIGAGACVGGINPCPGQLCDESNDTCVDCLVDGDCDDGDPCTEPEVCVSGNCVPSGVFPDCNTNGVPDECDISTMFSLDCNENGVPDDCDLAMVTSLDCNTNGVPDECDVLSGFSDDCDENGIPDECESMADCNTNGTPDFCDILDGTSDDLNDNDIPDECEARLTIFVDDDAASDPGPGDPDVSDPSEDGTSTNPFDSIQEAVDVAKSGDAIIVLDGTYSGTGNFDIDLGGRDLELVSSSGADACTIDAQGAGQVFFMVNGESQNLIVRGFTITGGLGIGGGAVSIVGASPTFEACVFTGNTATDTGGAVQVASSSTATVLRGCLFHDNTASNNGGAVSAVAGVVDLKGCTVADNSAGSQGGGLYASLAGTLVTASNSILWDNSAASGDQGFAFFSGGISVNYSDVQGGMSGFATNLGALFYDPSNINSDPLFVNAAGGDYSLGAGSPCIDAGDPSFTAVTNQGDLQSQPRVMDADVDMGADESHVGLVMSYPTPNVTDQFNVFDIRGVNPSQLVFTLVGFTAGPSPLIPCVPDPILITDGVPVLTKFALADVNGDTAVVYNLPSSAMGLTALFQTVEFVSGFCNVSPVFAYTVP